MTDIKRLEIQRDSEKKPCDAIHIINSREYPVIDSVNYIFFREIVLARILRNRTNIKITYLFHFMK